jgi:hypothetical protein
MASTTGTSALLAIVAALGSFFATFSGRPIIGLLAALAALPLGVLGLVMSVSPRVSGGILSIIAIVLGAFGLLAALLGLFGILLS